MCERANIGIDIIEHTINLFQNQKHYARHVCRVRLMDDLKHEVLRHDGGHAYAGPADDGDAVA